MTLLSDKDILATIKTGQLKVSPWNSALLQPASIDVRLGNRFRYFSDWSTMAPIDPKVQENDSTLIQCLNGQDFVLAPGQFALGSTVEDFAIPDNLGARFEGKSSIGRLGLLTHVTAGFIDPGFSGSITLELHNLRSRPIRLWPGMKIGQVCFYDLSSHAQVPYGKANNHYQGQNGPTPSQSHLQFQED